MPPCPFKAYLQKKRAHSRMKSQTTAPKPWSGGASSPSLRPSRKRLLFLNSPLRHAKSGTVQRFHKKTEGGTSTKKRGWPLKTTLLPTAFGSENTEDCLTKTGSVANRKVCPHPLPPDTTRGWLLMHRYGLTGVTPRSNERNSTPQACQVGIPPTSKNKRRPIPLPRAP